MDIMIGLEVHVQLNTESKMFCSDKSEPGDAEPNSNTCPICLGFPGAKPKINRKAVNYGILIGTAVNSKINTDVFFSRKVYFYPDLAKSYQITQFELPIASGGHLTVGDAKIRMRRVHIEEDPAKTIYVNGDITNAESVLLDYNRAGVGLAEIVTEPDFKTPKQARQFLEKLAAILEYLEVYDPRREMSLRVDANISMNGGERVEIKNITGFENVEKALSYEIVRQSGLARMGVKVDRETRHFNAELRTTKTLRKKEYEADYGYIFEPDLPILSLGKDLVASVTKNMPELPEQMSARFMKTYSINEYYANVMVYSGKDMAEFFEKCVALHKDSKRVASWMVNYIMKSLNWRSEHMSESKVTPEGLAELLDMIDSGEITERYAKELVKNYVDTGTSPRKLAEGAGATPTESDVLGVVKEVVKANAAVAKELKAGKEEAMQFLIGQVLKKTNRKADPKIIKALIMKEISK
jgi:aspartyl-tRNA(Asn)/glutamyl-tRNA(Gln) amidotransferase subunit B